jgi:SHS2 domain-containing protein
MADERATYREIEHTADIAIEVTADTVPALFASAGEALYALIVDPATIDSRDEITIEASADGLEDLLHAWLCELLALFNVQGFVGRRCKIAHIGDSRVQGQVSGEKLDLKRHAFRTEIKGVTYHDFEVWQKAGRWHARVIFDV